ncbi:MAG: hypothetical protein WB676_27870 [Bryobacteraceae bacterium]
MSLALFWKPFFGPAARKLAARRWFSIALLASLPVALRLLLLPHHPVPTPDVYDEFGHLLVADTLRLFRLANPPHSLPQFFETFFVLQQPTYSSIYPLGQGIALAFGWTLLGLPWAGVLLSAAAFCASCYWMLRAWTTPAWALAGGMLAVIEFGPLNPWMNCYWGGALAAAAGCLVFGSLPRLRFHHGHDLRDAVLLGLGLSIHVLTRPYESVFLLLSVILFFVPDLRYPGTLSALRRPALVAAICVLPAVVLTLLQDKQVTGSFTTLPYQLSQYQYGVPAALTFQANPIPHRELTPQQALDYKMQTAFHGPGKDTVRSYLLRMEYRVRFYRFFFLPELYLALPFFLWRVSEWRYAWVAATCLLFALGINFFPAFQFHYLAACTSLFILISIAGLKRLAGIAIYGRPAGYEAARLLLWLCFIHFCFWYTVHIFENGPLKALREFETWNGINHESADPRVVVNRMIDKTPGQLLVFVRYWPQHIFQKEWVWNAADIDGARVVWARDLGPDEDQKLIRYFPGRRVLLLEPDARPPLLGPYVPSSPTNLDEPK